MTLTTVCGVMAHVEQMVRNSLCLFTLILSVAIRENEIKSR